MTTIFAGAEAGRSPSVGAGRLLDRTGSVQGRTATRALRLDEVIDALFDLDETQTGTSAHRAPATEPGCEARAA